MFTKNFKIKPAKMRQKHAFLIALPLQSFAITTMISIWPSTECLNPPAAMLSFSQTDPTNVTPPNGEKWPPVYAYFQQFYFGLCGAGPVSLPECCYASLDLASSLVNSVAYMSSTEPFSYTANTPRSAIGATYCRIVALDASGLYGYSSALILNGTCYEGLACTGSNLIIHPTQDCSNNTNLETFSAAIVASSHASATISSFTLNLWTIADAEATLHWTTYVPTNLLIPGTQTVIDIGCAISVALSMLILILACLHFYHQYFTKQMFICLLYGVGETMWLIDIALQTGYSYIQFKNNNILSLYQEFSFMFDNIASFYTVIVTAYILMRAREDSNLVKYVVYFGLTLMHLGLSGIFYLMYWVQSRDSILTFTPIFEEWSLISHYWIFFMLLFEMLPFTYLIYQLIFKKKVIFQTYKESNPSIHSIPEFAEKR